MANSLTYNHTKIHFIEGSAPTTPDTGEWVVYAKTTGLFVMDDAGTEYGPFGDAASAVAHITDTTDAHPASAVSVLDTATNFTGTDVEAVLAELQDNIDAVSGGGAGGRQVYAFVTGAIPGGSGTGAPTQDQARLYQVVVSAPMLLSSCAWVVSVAGTGTVEWGLFDASANPAAATKLAGGSGNLNGTGQRTIAATGAPVSIDPGSYWLITEHQTTTIATLRRTDNGGGVNLPFMRVQNSYTWDDTPDITTGWSDTTIVETIYLVGAAS